MQRHILTEDIGQKAKELDSNNKDIYLELAVVYARINKMTEACDELSKAVALGLPMTDDLKIQFCK